MKFSVITSALIKPLEHAIKVIPNKPVLLITEDFHFQVSGNKLTVTTTDLQSTLIQVVDIMADGEFSFCVPSKMLLDTLKALPIQPVTFEVQEDVLILKASTGKYKIGLEDSEDFPIAPEPDGELTLELPGARLINAIKKTLFACSKDEFKPALTGVYFQMKPGELTLVSTDAHRLVEYRIENLDTNQELSVIIPAHSLKIFDSVFEKLEQVGLCLTAEKAFFIAGETILICNLIDANYPRYREIIPDHHEGFLTITNSDLRNALTRVLIYSDTDYNACDFIASEDSLSLKSAYETLHHKADELLPCIYQGEKIDLRLNIKYLQECLKALDCEEISMKIEEQKPVTINPLDSFADDDKVMMLVMPIKK